MIRLLRVALRRSDLLSVRCTLPSSFLASQRSRRLIITLYRVVMFHSSIRLRSFELTALTITLYRVVMFHAARSNRAIS